MIRAVIDTNILLQGITKKGLAGQIIDAWVGRRFLPCVSTALALEYEEVLKRYFPKDRHIQIEMALQSLLERADFVPIYFRYRTESPDPKDDMVIECVLNSGSCLVTENIRDFKNASQSIGFQVLTQENFLKYLGGEKR